MVSKSSSLCHYSIRSQTLKSIAQHHKLIVHSNAGDLPVFLPITSHTYITPKILPTNIVQPTVLLPPRNSEHTTGRRGASPLVHPSRAVAAPVLKTSSTCSENLLSFSRLTLSQGRWRAKCGELYLSILHIIFPKSSPSHVYPAQPWPCFFLL